MSTTTDTTHARKSSSRLVVPSGGADHPSTTPLSPSGRAATTAAGGGTTPTVTARLVWNNNTASNTSSSHSSHQFYFLYWQRLIDVRQMDVQAALDQMRTLLSLRPQGIYKTAYYRKQTKNHWSRDDPAFLVLQFIFLTLAAFSYGIAFRAPISNGLSFWVASVVWNWLGLGMVVATTTQYIADRYLQSHAGRTTHVQQNVEWLYAFDIHCNSFFPVFCVLYGLQFFTLPVVLGNGLVPLLLANTMYGAAFCWYWYITHLGYRSLPFLTNTEVFLLPMAPIGLLFASLVVLYPFGYGVNAAQFMAKFYFV